MTKKKSRKINDISLKKERDLEWFYLLPLLFIVAIVPLIVYAKDISLSEIEKINWRGGDTSTDFFSYYKAICFSAMVYISIILLVLLKISGGASLKKSKYYIPLGIYWMFVLASYFMSEYKVVAVRGFVEQFQGVWVMMAYGLVIVAVINFIQNEKHVRMMIGSYIFLGLVTAVIGAGQYFGYDLFKTEFGKYMMLPENLHHLAKTMKFKFEVGEIYATMYNTNFVGSFACIMMSLAVALFVSFKDKKKTALAGVFFILMEIIWIGSNSRAGLVGFLLGAIFIVALFRKKLIKIVALLVIAVIVMTGMNIYSDGQVFDEFLSMSLSRESERLDENFEDDIQMLDLKFEGYSLDIVTERESLNITFKDGSLSFLDENGDSLAVINNDKEISFEDATYSGYKIIKGDVSGKFSVEAYDNELVLYITKDNGLKMRSSGGALGTTEYPDRLELLDGYEKFATNRGYLWSRSIPMLNDTLLIGYGPDTYVLKFPQKDYVGKMNAYGDPTIIVDKPHNVFLQIALNTGLVSMLALVAVFLMYFIDSIKLYWKRDMSTFLECMGVGCVTAMISYLGAGMFNDQIISVAPVFYVLVGLGIAINDIIKKQKVGE
jgi:hypothetical protein